MNTGRFKEAPNWVPLVVCGETGRNCVETTGFNYSLKY